MLKVLLREPLVHFILLAMIVFAVYYGVSPARDQTSAEEIIISAPKIEQLAAIFAKTWQRPPTSQELKSLVDDYVREEIYVREALALRLDEDDTIIRRRLRQKMEFLNAAETEATIPTEEELEAYLKSYPQRFEIGPKIAFQQVFLNPERHGEETEPEARSVLKMLKAGPEVDPASLGDPTLLPAALPLTDKPSIGQIFGVEFADALDQGEIGQWQGPVTSSFGLHLLRVTAREPRRVPELSEVRDMVLREWANDRRQEAEQQRLEEHLKRYDVKIEMPAVAEVNQ
jgi:hypothetical protein